MFIISLVVFTYVPEFFNHVVVVVVVIVVVVSSASVRQVSEVRQAIEAQLAEHRGRIQVGWPTVRSLGLRLGLGIGQGHSRGRIQVGWPNASGLQGGGLCGPGWGLS